MVLFKKVVFALISPLTLIKSDPPPPPPLPTPLYMIKMAGGGGGALGLS